MMILSMESEKNCMCEIPAQLHVGNMQKSSRRTLDRQILCREIFAFKFSRILFSPPGKVARNFKGI